MVFLARDLFDFFDGSATGRINGTAPNPPQPLKIPRSSRVFGLHVEGVRFILILVCPDDR